MLNVDDERFIRCVNCWMLHTNNKSILDHWNNGACLFYCRVCGKNFHDNIKDLQSHCENEHGIKFQAINVTTTDAKKKPVVVAAPASKKPACDDIKKSIAKMQPDASNGFSCVPCKRVFKSRQAYSTHYTLIHKRKESITKTPSPSGETKVKQLVDNTINPKTVLRDLPISITISKTKSKSKTMPTSTPTPKQAQVPVPVPTFTITSKSNKSQKVIAKKLMKRPDEDAMKTVIRKPPKKSIILMSVQTKPSGKLAEPVATMADKSLVPANTQDMHVTTATPASVLESLQNPQVSQDQTVSTTYIPAPSVSHVDEMLIKPEPEVVLDFSNTYVEMTPCNGWAHMPSQYDAWNQNVLDSYDTSPRLKVKDLNDLQDPRQRYPQDYTTLDSHRGYSQNSVYKEQPIITPSQNMSGLQIQNVQSYQTHSVQQQPFLTDYTCVNGMNSSMNLPEHSMCTTNLYDMHNTQAQPARSQQLINPMYLLPSNNPHIDYHY